MSISLEGLANTKNNARPACEASRFAKSDRLLGSIDSMRKKPMKIFSVILLLASMSAISAFAQQKSYNTSKALLEVNDPTAKRNPVRSIAAANWKAVEAKSRLKIKPGQDIAVVCEGAFPAGYIADDLYRQNGDFKRSFIIHESTTILDLCNQMEDIMRKQNPRLFK